MPARKRLQAKKRRFRQFITRRMASTKNGTINLEEEYARQSKMRATVEKVTAELQALDEAAAQATTRPGGEAAEPESDVIESVAKLFVNTEADVDVEEGEEETTTAPVPAAGYGYEDDISAEQRRKDLIDIRDDFLHMLHVSERLCRLQQECMSSGDNALREEEEKTEMETNKS